MHATERKLAARSKDLTDSRVAQQRLQTLLDAVRVQQSAAASKVCAFALRLLGTKRLCSRALGLLRRVAVLLDCRP